MSNILQRDQSGGEHAAVQTLHYLLSFLESVLDVANKLKEPSAKEKEFEDVVKEAEQAAVLVLVY